MVGAGLRLDDSGGQAPTVKPPVSFIAIFVYFDYAANIQNLLLLAGAMP